MDATLIEDGLWFWLTAHPGWEGADDWPEKVGCVCWQTADDLVLVDPLVPSHSAGAYWAFVDSLAVDRKVWVLLTAPWHERSTAQVSARYSATVWAHEAGGARLSIKSQSTTLPTGVEVFELGGVDEGEVAFYLPSLRALLVAEFLMGVGGGLRLLPSPALYHRSVFRRSLDLLRELPIERVFVAHGESVFHHGHDRLDEALAASQ